MMRQLDNEELLSRQEKILEAVDCYCRNSGLHYSLAFGTLLGAVRHKGYIPWDDDIDIMMPRNDYDQFVDKFHANGLILNVLNEEDECILPYAKISDASTTLVENSIYHCRTLGVNIDIFPIDKAPDSPSLLKKLLFRKKILNICFTLKTVVPSKERNALKNAILKIAQSCLKPLSIYTLSSKMQQLSCKYKDSKTNLAGIIVPADNRRKEILPIECFESYIDLPFEGKSFMAIQEYDKYLTASYGDYMQLPPEEKRVTHHSFKAYKK